MPKSLDYSNNNWYKKSSGAYEWFNLALQDTDIGLQHAYIVFWNFPGRLD